MARIRLYLQQSLRTSAQTALDAWGNPIILPFLRISTMLRIGLAAPVIVDSLIDTGAPLTVVPRIRWEKFAGEIEWLHDPTPAPARSWLTNISGKTGGSCLCRVGRIVVQAFDLESPPALLPPLPVVAQFELQDTGDDRILTGLHGGILEGRRLVVEPDLRQAWIEER